MTEEWAAGYLSAMIDGEGCVTSSTQTNGSPRRNVRISNTERSVIETCVEAGALLGVYVSIHGGKQPMRAHEKPVWEAYIGGNDIRLLASVVDLKIERKKVKLLEAAWRPVFLTRRAREQPIEKVARMRKEGMTYQEIADYFGVTKSAAHIWGQKAEAR